MVKFADEIFRDFETDGVPSSGKHNPIKSDIREWGSYLEDIRSSLAITFATWAELEAVSGSIDGAIGEVPPTDTGTHLQATATGYDGDSVSNAGRYSYNTTWARWVWIAADTLSDTTDFDAAIDTTYRVALWMFVGETDGDVIPINVAEDGLVLSYVGDQADKDEATYRRALWDFEGDAEVALTNIPDAVAEDGLVLTSIDLQYTISDADRLMPYVSSGTVRAIGGTAGDRLLTDDLTWLSVTPYHDGALAVRSDGELRAIGSSGDTHFAHEISIYTGDGQSNAEGQATSGAAVVLGDNPWPAYMQTLTLRGSANIWLSTITSGGTSVELDGDEITGYAPLTDSLGADGTHGSVSIAAVARWALAHTWDDAGYVPRVLVWCNSEGGQEIANLLSDAGTGYYAYANAITAVTRAVALCPADTRIVYRWMDMVQGEADTTDSSLGTKHDLYRSQVATAAAAITGQVEPTRMLSWQPSSFTSASDGVRSILSHALDVAGDGLFFCGGPTYPYEFSSDFLHQTSAGHVRRGETAAAIQQIIDRTGTWTPLHMTAAHVTGTYEITVTLSEDAEIATDDVVASIDYAGITVTGATISDASVSGSSLVLTTSDAASAATAVNAGLADQTSPRTAAAIPRTNIRATTTLGQYSDGTDIHHWMCHQSISLT